MNIQPNFSTNFRGAGYIKARDAKKASNTWRRTAETVDNTVKKVSEEYHKYWDYRHIKNT